MDNQKNPEGGSTSESQSAQDTQNTFYQPQGQSPVAGQSAYEGYDLGEKQAPQQAVNPNATISWEASEYIHHSKGAGWIFGLIGITIVFVALAIWLQAWTFAILLVVMAVAMGVYAFRPPHVLHYTLTHSGLQVGEKSYNLADFRAFGIISDGAFYTIMLIPTKRFMPAVNVYFAEQDGEKIVDILGQSLPMEQLQLDSIERLMRKLRF